MHEGMHNRAADAEILRQLSTMRSEIHQLKNGARLSSTRDKFNSERTSHHQGDCQLEEPSSRDSVLESTIDSVENFVYDPVSTVYDRSASGSEASWSWNGDARHPISGGEPKSSSVPRDCTLTRESTSEDSPEEEALQEYRCETYIYLETIIKKVESCASLSIEEQAYVATLMNDHWMLRRLITKKDFDINAQYGTGSGPQLHLVSVGGNLLIVDLLLQAGAKFDAEHLGTALGCALVFG